MVLANKRKKNEEKNVNIIWKNAKKNLQETNYSVTYRILKDECNTA